MTKAVALEDEFKKNSELKEEDLSSLREWYHQQTHLPQISDTFLVLFLHSCYFNMEETKVTIEKYFTMRTGVPELFSNRDPFVTSLKDGKPVLQVSLLNNSTPEGYKVQFAKLYITDPSALVASEAMKFFFMVSDIEFYFNGTSPGFVIIVDMTGVKLGHLLKLSIGIVKKFLLYVQEAMPVRLKSLHFINTTGLMDTLLSIMKPFLRKELLEMLHLHSNYRETLQKFLPLEILPSDYNGKDKSCNELLEQSLQLVQENKLWFEEESKLRVDESKMQSKTKALGTK